MAKQEPGLEIPTAWEQLELDILHGLCLVIGSSDVGKSTFSRYLFRRLTEAPFPDGGSRKVAFLDGDVGQNSLGPPATMTLTFDLELANQPFAEGRLCRWFVGTTTPVGHMLPTLVSAARLVRAGREAAADAIVYDTCGLVDRGAGGLALKSAKIDLLGPSVIFAIQRGRELEPFLLPFQRSHRVQIVRLKPSPAVRRRDMNHRQAHRSAQFARHFYHSNRLSLDWMRLAVFPAPRFCLHRLVALENFDGFTLALGIVTGIDDERRLVELLTPLRSLAEVNSLRLGDILVEPETFRDSRLNEGA